MIEAQARLRIDQQDLSLLVEPGNAEQLIQQVLETQVRQAFDLRQGPLLRATLVRLAADEHVLVLVQHHIVSDGWSMQLMVEELVQSGHATETNTQSLLDANGRVIALMGRFKVR